MDRLGRWIVRRRGLATLLLAALTALAVGVAIPQLAQGLPFEFSPHKVFAQDPETRAEFDRVTALWGRDDNDLLFLLEGPVFTPAGVEALRALHHAVAGDPSVVRVDSLVSVEGARRVDGRLVVSPLLPDSLSPEGLDAARRRAAEEPGVGGLLVAEGGGMAAVRARLDPALHTTAELEEPVRRLRALRDGLDLPPGYAVHLTGLPELRVEIVHDMLRDQAVFLVLAGVAFAVVLMLLFRGPVPGLLPLLAVGVAVVWALCILVAAGVTFNLLSALVPVLVLVIGLSDGIHLLARYRDELLDGLGAEAAMGRTVERLTMACFLTSLTTALGFASLATAHSEVVRTFGRDAAVAVMAAFVGVMLALPVLLAWLPVGWVCRGESREQSAARPMKRWLLRVDALVARWPVGVLVLAGIVTGGALWTARDLTVSYHVLEMYDADHPEMVVFKKAVRHLGGVVPVVVHMEADEPGTFRDPAVLAGVAEVEAALSAQPEVGWTVSLAGVVRSVTGLVTGTPGLPDDAAAVEQVLLVAEMGGEQSGLDRLVDADYTRSRVLGLADDADAGRFLEVRDHLVEVAADAFHGLPVRVSVGGDGIAASEGVRHNLGDLVVSTGSALVVITLTMMVLLRSVRLALVAMVPNAIPLILTAGFLRLSYGTMETGTTITFSVALGLAVDNTIHFLVRMREERAGGARVSLAIRRTFLGAGSAIVFTSLLLLIGFGVMNVSDLVSTRHFATMTLVTLAGGLVSNLFVLPALLHLLGDHVLDPPGGSP